MILFKTRFRKNRKKLSDSIHSCICNELQGLNYKITKFPFVPLSENGSVNVPYAETFEVRIYSPIVRDSKKELVPRKAKTEDRFKITAHYWEWFEHAERGFECYISEMLCIKGNAIVLEHIGEKLEAILKSKMPIKYQLCPDEVMLEIFQNQVHGTFGNRRDILALNACEGYIRVYDPLLKYLGLNWDQDSDLYWHHISGAEFNYYDSALTLRGKTIDNIDTVEKLKEAIKV